MRAWRILGLSLALTAIGVPQDLPPEVIRLARIKDRVRADLEHLPTYTCLETIQRFQREGSAHLGPLDTVQLEVFFSGGHEWFGAPGGRTMSHDDPSGFVASGMIGTGNFGIALHNILNNARFTYAGKEERNGKPAEKYSFHFDPDPGAFRIAVPGADAPVGEQGFLWADAKTLDLIRLEYNADEIPAELPIISQTSSVDYGNVSIGGRDILLPQRSDEDLLHPGNIESFSHTEFSQCRAYETETTIHFGDGPDSPPQTTAPKLPPAPPARIPAMLKVTVELTTPMTNQDVVGKLIEGRASTSVSSKGKVIFPAGAIVHGRIRRLERFDENTWIIGLEFTEVESPGGTQLFYADLLGMDTSKLLKLRHTETTKAGKVEIKLAEVPGVTAFFVTGQTFILPPGFHTIWRTRGPIRGLTPRAQ
ncbi:MAG TPA: hypothetical protein VHC90_10815 [Bryobacteraceae bacterium]|nr:hypothetical protein [Bryobacteraceae bacterium]